MTDFLNTVIRFLTGSVENFLFERFEKNTTEDTEVHGANSLYLGGKKTLLCDPLCLLWFLRRTKRGGFLQSLPVPVSRRPRSPLTLYLVLSAEQT